MAGAIGLLILLLAGALGGGHEAAASPHSIGVRGNHLVDANDHPVRLLGVNRSGTEYRCEQGYGIFEGPADDESIAAIASWGANAVRVPLNESCWLGIGGVSAQYGGEAYRAAIVEWVRRLEAAGMYVVLDLQFAAPGTEAAREIIPMPDAAHAPAFWRSVAKTFAGDRAVLFDLYNEPHDVDWDCWERGCRTRAADGTEYEAVGMARLVRAVRSTGARQPILLSGIDYAHDLTEWEAHLPPDPRHALVASLHTYDFGPCDEGCREDLAALATRHPLVTAELGESDCATGYIDDYMNWADRHGVSYLGWAWNAGNGWTCSGGPALISDYDGTPTPYGIGLRNHLRALAR